MKTSKVMLVVLLFVTATLVATGVASAQVIYGDTVLTDIPEQQREEFINSIKRKVESLQVYITKISSKATDPKYKQELAESAVKLFESANNIVQISNARTGTVAQLPVRLYFLKLAGIKAEKVEITFYKGVRFETIRKGTDGYFYGTALMFQETAISKGDNLVSYKDRTVKRVNFKSKLELMREGDEVVQIIETFLQDINVKETI